MKKALLSLVLVIFGLNIYGNQLQFSDDKDLVIENNEIKSKGVILGKIEIDETELPKEKAKDHLVKIFNKKNELIASYLVTAHTNQKESQKRAIIQATLKTYKDKVTHMGSNFLNFHEVEMSESESQDTPDHKLVPQFTNVLKYLVSNNYL